MYHLMSNASKDVPKTSLDRTEEMYEAIRRDGEKGRRGATIAGIDPDQRAPYLTADDYEAAVGRLSERRPLTELEGRAFYHHLEILRNLDEEFGPLAA